MHAWCRWLGTPGAAAAQASGLSSRPGPQPGAHTQGTAGGCRGVGRWRACEVYALPRHHSASCLRESSRSAFLNFTVACAAAQRSAAPSERRTRGAKGCKLGARLLDHGVRLWPLPEVRQLQQRAAPPRQGLGGAACQAEPRRQRAQ